MGYRNAADILPENLLEAIQAYIEGEVVYIPKTTPRKDWGEGNGSEEGLGRGKRLPGILPQKKSGNQKKLPCRDIGGGTGGQVRAGTGDDPEYYL